MEDIEELDEENAEVEEYISSDLSWTCKKCGKENVEYNIPTFEQVICVCTACGKKYEYYHYPY